MQTLCTGCLNRKECKAISDYDKYCNYHNKLRDEGVLSICNIVPECSLFIKKEGRVYE